MLFSFFAFFFLNFFYYVSYFAKVSGKKNLISMGWPFFNLFGKGDAVYYFLRSADKQIKWLKICGQTKRIIFLR